MIEFQSLNTFVFIKVTSLCCLLLLVSSSYITTSHHHLRALRSEITQYPRGPPLLRLLQVPDHRAGVRVFASVHGHQTIHRLWQKGDRRVVAVQVAQKSSKVTCVEQRLLVLAAEDSPAPLDDLRAERKFQVGKAHTVVQRC